LGAIQKLNIENAPEKIIAEIEKTQNKISEILMPIHADSLNKIDWFDLKYV
jgi:hypothetical protein